MKGAAPLQAAPVDGGPDHRDLRLALAELFARERDPDEVLRRVARLVGEYLRVSRVGFGEIDLADDTILIPIDWTDGLPSMVGRHRFFRDSLFAQHYAHGRTVAIDDAAQWSDSEDVRLSLAATHTRACLVVPLLDEDDRLVALFAANHHLPRHWSADDIALMDEVAGQVWRVLTQLRLTAELREREEQFRTIAESMPAMCWLADRAGRAYWGNRRFEAFFAGTSAAAGDPTEVVHPDEIGEANGLWARALASGEAVEMPLTMRGADGVYRPFLCSATPILDASGAIARWCGVMVDLSEKHARDRREALLRGFSDRTRMMADPREIVATMATMLAEHLRISLMTWAEQAGADPRVFDVFGVLPGALVPAPASRHVFDSDYDEMFAIYERGEPFVVHDSDREMVGLNGAVRAQAARTGSRSGINVPLVKNGRVVAVLSALHGEPREYTPDEVALCRDMAERLWESVSRAQAEEALQERERNGAFLIGWSDAVRHGGDGEAILEATLERLGRHLDVSRVNYSAAVGSGDVFCICREWLNGARSIVGGEYTLSEIGDEIERAFRAGETVVIEDTDTDARTDEISRVIYRATDAIAIISVPLVRSGRVVAVLSVQQKVPRRWRPGDVQLLEDLADRTWSVLERARAEAALRERDRAQTFLLEWSDAVRAERQPRAILTLTLAKLGAFLGASRVNFGESDPNGVEFNVLHEWRLGETSSVMGYSFPFAALGERVHAAHRSGEPVVVTNVATDALFDDGNRPLYESIGLVALLAIPLVKNGKLEATLSIQQTSPRRWTDEEIAIAREVADRTWAVLERAKAEEALQERERNQAFLIAWADELRHQQAPRQILSMTLAKLGEHLGVNRANYAEGEEGPSLVVLQEWEQGAITVAGQRFPLAALGAGVVAAHLSGEPVVIDDVTSSALIDDSNRPLYQSVAVGAFLTVPLVRAGRLDAVLSVQSVAPRIWLPGEISLMREIADRTWAVLERARSEERLAANEALLAAFMENAPLGIHLKDGAGRYIRINPEFSVAVGLPPEEIIGRHPTEIFPSSMWDRIMEAEARTLAGELSHSEYRDRPNERYKSALTISFPILGEGAARMGGFTIDLTDRERAEDALKKSRDALYQSEKLSALGSMLAGVSHELNNPLSIVVAQSVMLERQTKGTDVAERAMKVRRAADRCARIVQTFLAMARQKRPHREAVDINGVVAAALELADYGLKTDGILVDRSLAPDLPPIPADGDQLHQIIINLVINAQQAMAEGGQGQRKLTVATGFGPEPRTLIVDIADSGPGIPEDMRRRIFEPFYTTKPQGVGTGVGLSFSQGLAEAHGGRLALLPTERGACFRLTLPIDAIELPLAAPESAAAPVPLPSRRALVVDDEPEIAEALAEFLSLEGFACSVAIGGAAAKIKLAQGSWDLVVSDIRMPGVDGPALYAWIEQMRPDLTARIAFTTGDTLGVAAAQFLAQADRPLLEKPFMPDAVQRLLQQMAL